MTRPTHPILAAHVKTGRIAHTYLLSGPEGEEKSEIAGGFARALNCEKGKIFQDCECLSCRKIRNRNHPDVRWSGEDEKARSIKIEEVRAILHEAFLKPYEGQWKVFILQGAERLTPDASNALLKTLEEPPGQSVFLLLVENKAHLLETIQSRAFEIRLFGQGEKDPKENTMIQILQTRGWPAFFESLQTAPRPELKETLEALMLHLRNECAKAWETEPAGTQKYLKAIDSVYETQESLQANVGQKLALTHLEIQIRRHCEEAEGRRSNPGSASPLWGSQ